MTPSSGLIICWNSSQVSGKLFTRLLVYYKRTQFRNSKLKKKKRCMGRCREGVQCFFCLLQVYPSSQPLSIFSNLEVLLTPRVRDFYGDFLTWTKPIINSVSSLSPFPGGWRNKVEISKLLIMARSFADLNPGAHQGVCLIGTNNAPIIRISKGI